MAGFCIVPRREPVIKPVLIRGRLVAFLSRQAQMPFPDMSRAVARLFEDLGKGDLPLEKMRILALVVNPTVDACPDVMAPRQQRSARRRTDGATGVKVREPGSLFRQGIQIRCFYRTTVAPEIGPPQVIGEQHDYIGSVFGEKDTCRKQAEKGKQQFHRDAV